MIATLQGRSGVNGVLSSSGFYLPLYDSGSGAVNTTLTRGVGSPTFSRSTAGACRLSTGLWKLDVASGVARSHYWEFSAGVYTYGGYLSESAATQILTAPRDMTNAAWTKGATVTVAQTGTGIDGVVNACSRVTFGAVQATNTVLQTITAAASSRTYSAFLTRVTGTGVIEITQDGVTFTDVTSQINSTSGVQVQLNASQLNAVIGIRGATNGDVILVDCNQFEAGNFATTPIPAAGSRNADILSYTYAGNANGALGTFYVETATLWSTSAPAATAVLTFDNLSAAPMYTDVSRASTEIGVSDGTGAVTKTGLAAMHTGVRKRASSWGGTTMSITGDGVAVDNGAFDGSFGSTLINIMSNATGGGNWSGTAKNVRIWTTQLANQQLQAITS